MARRPISPDLRPDALAPYRAAVIGIRLASIAFAAAMAGPGVADRQWRITAIGLALVVYHAVRVLSPLQDRGRHQDAAAFALEAGIHIGATLATGSWNSPFAFPLLSVIVIIGFARGLKVAVPVAGIMAALVDVPTTLQWWGLSVDLSLRRQWTLEVLLVALVAGYARRITGDASRNQSEAMGWIEQLTDANQLLSSLHQVAQTLPASLDIDGALDGILAELRKQLRFDGAAVLVADDTDGRGQLARYDGASPGSSARLLSAQLPFAAGAAIERRDVVDGRIGRIPGDVGFRTSATFGRYAPLIARDAVVGLIAIEYDEAPADPSGSIATHDRDLLCGLMEPAGLAVDNARWFARLRMLGAEEERTRIAHDLHDGVGQTLAYLGFELERLKRSAGDAPIADDLGRLRGDLGTALGEIRETLFDLRTDVTEETGLATVLERCVSRIQERSHVEVTLDSKATTRPTLRQERELWRLAQGAIVSAERRSGATEIAVSWRCDEEQAELCITHDVAGLRRRVGDMVDLDMLRARADALGAALAVETRAGQTTIRCTLDLA